jgi:hypothetical protein
MSHGAKQVHRKPGSSGPSTFPSAIRYGFWPKFTVTVTLPEEFVIAATGVEVESTPADEGLVTRRFVSALTRDFAIMTGPDYKTLSDEADDILVTVYYRWDEEAAQAAKVVLANMFKRQKKLLPLLPDTKLEVKKIRLLFLPFETAGRDLIQYHTGISITKRAMELGGTI